MPVNYYQVRAREMMWDIPRIISAKQGLQGGFAATFTLAPTAVLPGTWILKPGGNILAFVWGVWFSTDTAISWTLFQATNPAPLTVRTIAGLVGAGASASWSADVAAAPASAGDISSGFAAANSYIDVVGKGWVEGSGNNFALVLSTGLVAANCKVTMHWTELNN